MEDKDFWQKLAVDLKDDLYREEFFNKIIVMTIRQGNETK
jgi:hypothetical protein